MKKNKVDVQLYTRNSPLTASQIRLCLKKIQPLLPELKNYFITIAVVDDVKMKDINSRFTGRNRATDVLSFVYNDISPTIEIIVSSDQAISNAFRFKNTPAQELLTYIIHGLLHAVGYNDLNIKNRARMFRKQREILRRIWNE